MATLGEMISETSFKRLCDVAEAVITSDLQLREQIVKQEAYMRSHCRVCGGKMGNFKAPYGHDCLQEPQHWQRIHMLNFGTWACRSFYDTDKWAIMVHSCETEELLYIEPLAPEHVENHWRGKQRDPNWDPTVYGGRDPFAFNDKDPFVKPTVSFGVLRDGYTMKQQRG